MAKIDVMLMNNRRMESAKLNDRFVYRIPTYNCIYNLDDSQYEGNTYNRYDVIDTSTLIRKETQFTDYTPPEYKMVYNWYFDSNLTNNVLTNPTYTVIDDFNLYCSFKDYYTVNFMGYNGSLYSSNRVYPDDQTNAFYGSTEFDEPSGYSTLIEQRRDIYKQVTGLYLDSNYQTEYNTTDYITSDATIYPKYEDMLYIYFYKDTDKASLHATKRVDTGTRLEDYPNWYVYSPTKANHKFKYWYDESTSKKIDTRYTRFYQDTNILPYFVRLYSINIYNVNNVLHSTLSDIEDGTYLGIWKEPEFVGVESSTWYYNSSRTGDTFSFSNTPVTSDMSLYPDVVEKQYDYTTYPIFFTDYHSSNLDTTELPDICDEIYMADDGGAYNGEWGDTYMSNFATESLTKVLDWYTDEWPHPQTTNTLERERLIRINNSNRESDITLSISSKGKIYIVGKLDTHSSYSSFCNDCYLNVRLYNNFNNGTLSTIDKSFTVYCTDTTTITQTFTIPAGTIRYLYIKSFARALGSSSDTVIKNSIGSYLSAYITEINIK